VSAPGAAIPVGPLLREDANGIGASADATTAASGGVTLSNLSPAPPQNGLTPPIDLFFNLLAVSRGKTVPSEILGSGNPAVAGQDFTLQQSPVTYLQDPASKSGDNYSSTVEVSVNGLQWSEVRSFYGQDANAQVFLLREDDQGQTHVVFGDGINGALLPTGVNNVVASYRYGAGAEAPAPETLTVVLNPQPGLKAIRNPLPPTGGADADPPSRIRTLAPQSVMTFDRAVSLDDYQAIAAGAPGVVQATADFVYDPVAQRPRVTIWVAGDQGAVVAVRAALAGAADPNRPVDIIPAMPIEAMISLTYVRDPRRDDAAVQAGLTAVLLDPDTGLFGANVVGIGQVFYDSQIYAACSSVPGIVAIHNLGFTTADAPLARQAGIARLVSFAIRFSPQPACTEHRHDPGSGNYFLIPNDPRHFQLNGSVAS
jgi:predicted phage baseplate assembly protein